MFKTLEQLRYELRKGIGTREVKNLRKTDDPVVERIVDDPLEGLEVSKKRYPTTKYTISLDGRDAVLSFGKHAGESVSTLVRTHPDYLEWMMKQDFPEELLEVVRNVMVPPKGKTRVKRYLKKK